MNREIPGIPELRRLVHRDEAVYGRIPWISRTIILPHVSIYLTWILLRLGLTGNQATGLMMFCAILGPFLYLQGGTSGYVAAAVLLWLAWILDHSDGEVLRFRKESSAFGIFLDRFTHRISYPLVYLLLGFVFYRETGAVTFLGVGAAAAYFWQLAVVQEMDRKLISKEMNGVELDPIGKVRNDVVTQFPSLEFPIKAALGGFLVLLNHRIFYLALAIAKSIGWAREYFMFYAGLLVAHWILFTVLDFRISYRRSVKAM